MRFTTAIAILEASTAKDRVYNSINKVSGLKMSLVSPQERKNRTQKKIATKRARRRNRRR